jgi:biotin-dependent carboxylase-like uncharacterized protein
MSALLVLEPGPLTTVQDLGRHGFAHLGVPPSGAVDPHTLARANALAGNTHDAPALEATLIGPTLRALQPVMVAVAGTRTNDGAWHLVPGTVLETGPTAGARAYIAVRGGIDVQPVLGSRATDLLTGIGPQPLAKGDVLAVGHAPRAPAATASVPGTTVGGGSLRIRLGPRDDWFTVPAVECLARDAWHVTPSANRVGIRLSGPPLERTRRDELLSEGLVTGAIQVPPNGLPILLLNDHPTTGGYPVIAVVSKEDLPRAGQLKPGDEVRFTVA